MKTDFEKFMLDKNISSLTLHNYSKKQNSKLLTPNNGWINPLILETSDLHATTWDVFSRLMSDRIIFLGDEIDSDVANIVNAQLLYLDSIDDEKRISLYINSPGGHVYDGLGVYDTMQYIKSDISTICTGLAASMASVLLAAGKEGMRLALPHSRIMIHQPLGNTGYSQASDIEIYSKEIQNLKKDLCEILAEHTKKPIKQIEKDIDRDKWLTSKESLDYGLIDKILVRKNENEIN